MKWFFSKQICSEPKIKHIPRASVIPKKKKQNILQKKKMDRGKTEVWFNAENVLALKRTLRACRMCFVFLIKKNGGGELKTTLDLPDSLAHSEPR